MDDSNFRRFPPRRTHVYEVGQPVWCVLKLCFGTITAASFRVSDLLTQRNPGYAVRFDNGLISTVMEPDLQPVFTSPEQLAGSAALVVTGQSAFDAAFETALAVTCQAGQAVARVLDETDAWIKKYNATLTLLVALLTLIVSLLAWLHPK